MAAIEVRPLGRRNNLVAFELLLTADAPLLREIDVRHAFVLWDPRGRPCSPYPEFALDRPMTGREVVDQQKTLWANHVEATRKAYGRTPLSGTAAAGKPLRGLLAFPLDETQLLSGGGRWTLAMRSGPLWHFMTEQIVEGVSRPLPPSRDRAEG